MMCIMDACAFVGFQVSVVTGQDDERSVHACMRLQPDSQITRSLPRNVRAAPCSVVFRVKIEVVILHFWEEPYLLFVVTCLIRVLH